MMLAVTSSIHNFYESKVRLGYKISSKQQMQMNFIDALLREQRVKKNFK